MACGVCPSKPNHVQFSHCSVMLDSLWPHGLQHARLPCLSPSPGACSNSCPLSQWCHPNISSVIPFSSRLQSFPASGSFPRNQFFALGGLSIGASASASSEYSGLISFRIDCFDLFASHLEKLARYYFTRRSPGGGHGSPPQYSCLENPMGRGAWWATVHGVMRVKDSRSTEYTQKLKPKLSFFVLEAHVFRQMCSQQYYRCILGGIWRQTLCLRKKKCHRDPSLASLVSA